VIARRFARFVGLSVLVAVLNFLAPRVLPGSPVTGGDGAEAVMLPAAARRALVETYHSDEPLAAQFGHYVVGLARGDLGYSLVSHRPVSAILLERLPWTLFLVGVSVLIAACAGGWMGWASAWQPRRRPVRLAVVVAVGAGALPEFLVAMLAIAYLASHRQFFPAGGALTPFLAEGGGTARFLADLVWHAALPGAVLVVGLVPPFALLVRNAVTPVLGQRFLMTARAKGLGERRVAWHAVRTALPPVVTLLGLRLGAAVAGAAVVERIFAYPGIGWLLYESVAARDYPVLQGVVFLSSLAVLVVTLLLDLTAVWLDPRLAEAQ
jgi:peptide/nickel transport system permease protein